MYQRPILYITLLLCINGRRRRKPLFFLISIDEEEEEGETSFCCIQCVLGRSSIWSAARHYIRSVWPAQWIVTYYYYNYYYYSAGATLLYSSIILYMLQCPFRFGSLSKTTPVNPISCPRLFTRLFVCTLKTSKIVIWWWSIRSFIQTRAIYLKSISFFFF